MDLAFERLWGTSAATAGVSFDGRTDCGIFIEVLERHGRGDELERNLELLTESYLAELPRTLKARGGRVLPGVPELLNALTERQPGFGLATGNFRRGAEAKLAHFGLWHHFLGGGFGDGHAVRRDLVAAGIHELATRLECEPDPADSLVLGDTPLDIEAAHLAGAKALGVATGRFSVDELLGAGADFAVPDLTDTEGVVDILLSG